MADETTAAASTEATAQPVETAAKATTSDGTKNAETQAEPMIPKSRLDEVLNKLKTFESDKAKADKAAQDAETKRLADEGKYKELFEKQQADLLAAQSEAKSTAIKLLQREVAAETNLPTALADRLRGESKDEMLADAKAILSALPKPTVPNINPNSGAGGAPVVGQMSEIEKNELAARLGVNPKFMQ